MPRSHPPYPMEFRQQLINLVRAGRTPEELAREFEPMAESIRNWAKQEREILSKAAAWFAQETGTIPKKSSGS